MIPIVAFTGKARSGKDTAAAFLCEEYRGVAIAFADPIKRFLAAAYGLTKEQLWGAEKESPIVVKCRAPNLTSTLTRVVGMELLNELRAFNVKFTDWKDIYAIDGSTTTPRRLMQTMGTEVVRAVKPDLWLEVGVRDALRILEGGVTYFAPEGVVPVGAGKDVCYNLVCLTDARFRNELLAVKKLGGLCVRVNREMNELSVVAQKHVSEVEQDSMPRWWFDRAIVNNGTLDSLRYQMEIIGRNAFGLPESIR